MPLTIMTDDEKHRRHRALMAGRLGQGVILVVLGTFFFGIMMGVGGLGYSTESPLARRFGPDAPRWAAVVLGAGLALVGLQMANWSRRGLEDAGFSPDEVRSRMGGLWLILALLMMGAGFVGILYARADQADNVWTLSAVCAVYLLAGAGLLVWSWPRWRGRGSL